MNANTILNVEDIVNTFRLRGASEYGGEKVTQLQHALQAAMFAEQEQGSPELISAALLHDFGHLLHNLPDDAPDQGVDDFHENTGHNALAKLFPLAVVEPIKLHVSAKRYLCTTDSNYFSKLSEASVTSLELQGGTMSAEELTVFESHSYWQDALRLRIWDDLAKDPNLQTPDLQHFIPYLLTAQT